MTRGRILMNQVPGRTLAVQHSLAWQPVMSAPSSNNRRHRGFWAWVIDSLLDCPLPRTAKGGCELGKAVLHGDDGRNGGGMGKWPITQRFSTCLLSSALSTPLSPVGFIQPQPVLGP